MRTMQRLVATAAMALAAALPAQAQDWPDRATKFVVPFPAGGVLDVLTRSFAEPLQASSGKSIVVENLPGAAGNIGIQQVARAPGDGSTLLFVPQGTSRSTPRCCRTRPSTGSATSSR